MSTGILGISLSGLAAAQAGVRTAQQNIANVNTQGYHRQEVSYSNALPAFSGSSFFGNGVDVASVARVYDQFLENELRSSQSQLARYDVYAGYATQVDGLLGDASTGLSSSLANFFAAVNEVANDPTSVSARQMTLTAGRNVAGRINNLDATLDGMQGSLDQQMGAVARQVTDYARQVADLNTQIVAVEGATGQIANDLRDRREQLTSEINKLVNVTPYTQADGTYSLYIGSGQPLVVGSLANSLATRPDPADASRQVPALVVNGTDILLDTRLVTGGQLGGLMAFREEVLAPAQANLARLAASFAMAFNQQHRAGFDQDGEAGMDFFANPAVPQTATTPDVYLNLADDRLLVPGDYLLSYAAGVYTLQRLSDGATWSNPDLATFNDQIDDIVGFTVSAAPVADGTWRINLDDYGRQMRLAIGNIRDVAAAGTAAGAPGDNANALKLAGLQVASVMNGGTTSFQNYYGQLVSQVASQANAADADRNAYDVLARQAYEAQQSVSGVNLDEEAANLIRFQQAYQAAAKAMQISSSLFEEILSIGR